MPEEISDRIANIKAHLSERKKTDKEEPKTIWKNIKRKIKPLVIGAGVAGSLAIGLLAYDFYSKGQNYPERNVLFSSSNTIYTAGSSGEGPTKSDKEDVIKVYSGGGIESKVGTYLFETTRESRGDIEYFNMHNSQGIRIASATQKQEIFQAGFRSEGSINFREQFAEIVLEKGAKAPQKYMVYKFAPERAWKESDVDVIEYPLERGLGENEPGIIESDKIRLMVNRLVEFRTTLGWFRGKEIYRTGTLLEDFEKTPENKSLAKEFFDRVKLLDSSQTVNKEKREKLVNEVMEIEEKMSKKTIYSTFESGFLKILPQGSIVYLGENPGKLERIKNWTGFGRKNHIRLVVDNHWDLWPGNWPIFNYFSIFNRYNNGGYTIKDRFGDIAKIEIKDFIFYYGPKVLYKYYFDLNGDGKIDKEKELIGEVLARTSNNERIGLEKLVKSNKPDADITFNVNYSFMAPTSDIKKGVEGLKLCAYIESMMPDQVHRGFGRHCLMGFINDIKSDWILFNELNIENESRALTQESTLAAKYDIVKALIFAKRPYAEQVARYYRIYDEFKGQFQQSNLLKEKIEIGPLPGIGLTLAAGIAGVYFLRRLRKNKQRKLDARTVLEKFRPKIIVS